MSVTQPVPPTLLTQAGQTVQINLKAAEAQCSLSFVGADAGVQVVVEASDNPGDGSVIWYGVLVTRRDTGAQLPGGTTFNPLGQGVSPGLRVVAQIEDAGACRVRVISPGLGGCSVRLSVGSFFATPPGSSGGAGGGATTTINTTTVTNNQTTTTQQLGSTVSDPAAEAALGTVIDPAAVLQDSSAAGSVVAQLRSLNAQLMSGLRELFRGWKQSELRLLRVIASNTGAQAGGFTPVLAGGDDDTDAFGDAPGA